MRYISLLVLLALISSCGTLSFLHNKYFDRDALIDDINNMKIDQLESLNYDLEELQKIIDLKIESLESTVGDNE